MVIDSCEDVGDRCHGLEYDYFECFTQKKADIVFRIKDNALFDVSEELLVNAEAAAYGVVRDQIIGFTNAGAPAPAFWRLVTILRDGMTNCRDIDAEVVGMLYRYRWEGGLFFKWLKCILKRQHFLLESPHGFAVEIYTTLILALLLCDLTISAKQRSSGYLFCL